MKSNNTELTQGFIINFLKERMKIKKISQKSLAKETGLSEMTISNYFLQKRVLPLDVFLKLLSILEIAPTFTPIEMEG